MNHPMTDTIRRRQALGLSIEGPLSRNRRRPHRTAPAIAIAAILVLLITAILAKLHLP
jgi:hypothetical protein